MGSAIIQLCEHQRLLVVPSRPLILHRLRKATRCAEQSLVAAPHLQQPRSVRSAKSRVVAALLWVCLMPSGMGQDMSRFQPVLSQSLVVFNADRFGGTDLA
eukprot:s1671_g3.t1